MVSGKYRLSEIVYWVGIEVKDMFKYLRIFIFFDFVRWEVLVIESERSRKVCYYFKDCFFEFWFCFVKLNRGRVEIGIFEMDWEVFNIYVGKVFEEILR